MRNRKGDIEGGDSSLLFEAEPGERLIDLYNRFFTCIEAYSDDIRLKAHRLRYQVYCIENQLEDPALNPDGAEYDRFDSHALQSVLIHRPSGMVAGVVRLILPERDGSVRPLPIRLACTDPLIDNPDVIPPKTTAEISRLSISKQFRRRLEDGRWSTDSRWAKTARRVIPHIAVGLMGSLVEMSARHGMTHLTAIMEPALIRLLSRMGIRFNPIGPTIDYHGLRQPCYSDLDVLLAGVWVDRYDIWQILTRDGTVWPLNKRLRDAARGAREDEAPSSREPVLA